MRALKDLDTSLDQFIELMERKDKQEIPIKQQEALGFVSVIEEAMVKGFPYEVPKQYAKSAAAQGGARCTHAHGAVDPMDRLTRDLTFRDGINGTCCMPFFLMARGYLVLRGCT